jgi:hypothetical protein
MQALNISSPRKRFGNLFPVFPSILSNSLSKHIVLFLRPMALHVVSVVQAWLLVFGRASFVKMGVHELLF